MRADPQLVHIHLTLQSLGSADAHKFINGIFAVRVWTENSCSTNDGDSCCSTNRNHGGAVVTVSKVLFVFVHTGPAK